MALLLVAIVGVCLTSCKGNDEPVPDPVPDPVTLVGTWTYLLGDEGYFTCTFTGDGTSGTFLYEENEKGKVEKESCNYTYAGGYLTLYEGNFSKTVKVISLTSTTLVIKDFPDNGNCTFTKKRVTKPSLVGTWKYTFSSGYVLLTFNQDGTGVYREYTHSRWDEPDPFTYTYSSGVITFFYYDDDDDVETAGVVELTSTSLVLKDWPDGGNCTFTKQ